MKKAFYRISMLLFLLLGMLSAAVQAAPASSIQLWINGERIKPEVPPQLVNGRTLVPVYIVQEGMGMDVSWNAKKRLVTISNGSKKVELTIDSKTARVNGVTRNLDVAPQIIGNRTFLPFRAVGELLGTEVGWESQTKSVILNQPVQIRVNGQAVTAKAYQHDGTYFVSAGEIAKAGGYTVKRGQEELVFTKGTEKKIVSANTYKEIDSNMTVPLSFVEELFGQKGSWDKGKTTYSVSSKEGNKVDEKPEVVIEKVKITGLVQTGETVEIQSNGKVRAKHFTMNNPFRIVVDVQNAELAFQSSPQLDKEGQVAIKTVRYSQFSPETVRVVIELNGSAQYDFTAQGEKAVVKLKDVHYPEPSVPKPPVEPPIVTPPEEGEPPVIEPPATQPATTTPDVPLSSKERVKIVVDAGHGGKDTGAIGNGVREKDLTLGISQKLAENLRADSKFDVVMTRESDMYPTLPERVEIANGEKADLFISVHINSGPSSAKGTETYYNTAKSKTYANTVHKYLIQATGFLDRKVRTAGYYVIKNTKMPAILVEIGFISNPSEAQQMASEEFQKRVADALYNGIREFVDQN
jgi:N-acetylmuramoyl-L-alanine amidase